MHKKEMNDEKAKNFSLSVKRLFKELNVFKISITIALLASILGSVLSIAAPSKLSKLTDKISEGLVVNTKNIEELNKRIFSQFNSGSEITSFDNSTTISIPDEVLKLYLSDFEMDNTIITVDDQIKYIKLIGSVDKENTKDIYKKMDELPANIYNVVKPSMDINSIKNIVFFLGVLYLLSALFMFIESLLMTNVSNNFARKLRSRIIDKINKLPLKFFDSNQTGDILSRITNDVDTIAQSMNQSLSTLVSSLTLLIGAVLMMFITNWIMALTAIISSIFGFIFMAMVLSKSQKYFNARQKELGNLNSHIQEVYSGLLVVKAYNAKKECDKKFDEYNEKVYEANRKSQFLSGLMHPMMHFVGNFGYVAVCVVGALLTMNNVITFGVIVAFITYVRLFTSPLSQIAQSMNSIQLTVAAGERVFEFLDEEEMPEENNKIVMDKNKVKGDIEFKNVKFSYDEGKTIIKNFSAKASSGEKIAIVGPTGAGKTTMVNLLMKFYEINSGEILIDGVNIKDIKRESVHSLFTMVLQDTWLFDGTIKENIIYNKTNVTDEQINKVCNIVGLTHFIKTLPNGINSHINESDSVSAGQRQLLTIARGMIDNAPFLILDEATSNVDTRTEELVQLAMDKLTKGKTSFIIAHRLSTIKNADLILVMKDGNIVESGKHEELINKKGFYAELYNSQFELR